MPDATLEHLRDEIAPASAESRALVPLTLPAATAAAPQTVRPDARFVTQLIAIASFAPQALWRAAPDEGARSYSEAFGRDKRCAGASRPVSRLA